MYMNVCEGQSSQPDSITVLKVLPLSGHAVKKEKSKNKRLGRILKSTQNAPRVKCLRTFYQNPNKLQFAQLGQKTTT